MKSSDQMKKILESTKKNKWLNHWVWYFVTHPLNNTMTKASKTTYWNSCVSVCAHAVNEILCWHNHMLKWDLLMLATDTMPQIHITRSIREKIFCAQQFDCLRPCSLSEIFVPVITQNLKQKKLQPKMLNPTTTSTKNMQTPCGLWFGFLKTSNIYIECKTHDLWLAYENVAFTLKKFNDTKLIRNSSVFRAAAVTYVCNPLSAHDYIYSRFICVICCFFTCFFYYFHLLSSSFQICWVC